MTKDTSYRLGRYEIIEKENGEVWWETHAGFGRLRAGRCFIEGKILFIGPYKTEEPGFLKGEFIQHLNKLPKWEKTKHYCSSYTIYNCKTGRISPELKTGRELGKQPKYVKDNIVSKETYDGGTTANLIYGAKAAMKVKEKVTGIWGIFKDWLRLCYGEFFNDQHRKKIRQMNTPRQNDLDIFTRIIHLGLVIFGLLAWGTGEWGDDYKKLKHIGFYVHSWTGMGVSFFVSLRLIYGIIGPRKARFTQWVPYTRDRLQFVWEDIMGLIRLRLPERQPRQGLASVVETFGLLVFSVMALTGSLLFFYLEPGIKAQGTIHFIKEIHEVGEALLPLFFAVHGGAVILHAFMGRHYWREMVFLKEQ